MEHQLTIYNTLDRKKELFVPLHAPHVGMYVCGPTVYGDAHLGHARPAITFDLLFRYLTHLGYKVRYVRNITDVGHLEHDADDGEDKISTSPKWKMDAASPASISGISLKSVTKSSIQPAPPDAITGTFTKAQTSCSSSKSNPCFTPSVSILFTTTSPAPIRTQRAIQSNASMPVFSLPPLANTMNFPSTRFTSTESTTH